MLNSLVRGTWLTSLFLVHECPSGAAVGARIPNVPEGTAQNLLCFSRVSASVTRHGLLSVLARRLGPIYAQTAERERGTPIDPGRVAVNASWPQQQSPDHRGPELVLWRAPLTAWGRRPHQVPIKTGGGRSNHACVLALACVRAHTGACSCARGMRTGEGRLVAANYSAGGHPLSDRCARPR